MKKQVNATKARKSRGNAEKVEPGSGNVFADLGFRDAEERLLKARVKSEVIEGIADGKHGHAVPDLGELAGKVRAHAAGG